MELIHIDPAQIVTQLIGFAIFVWLVSRFAWKPILTVLDQRRAHIEEELRKTAQGKAEMERLQAEYQRRISAIEDEARAKIQQAILNGKRIATEIHEQARAQGAAALTKAKETIELELAKAKVTLRDEVAAMTLEAVERILRHKLDPKTDRQLIETVLAQLDEEQARA